VIEEDDWLDDMLEGYLPILDWQTQSYFIRLVENSTLSEAEQDELIDRIVTGRFKEGELETIKGNLKLNAKREIDYPNPSQTAISQHIKNITK
jgi:hypothetical protein